MPTITIDQSGCRACNLCVEICPTDVLEMDGSDDFAKVVRQDDCIGCTSCMYICPSRCLTVSDYIGQRPFYRIEENRALISKFLQKKPAEAELTDADYDEALKDVSTRLLSLVESVSETMGRGQKALGRQSGQIAAMHLPELYEAATIEETLERLAKRYKHSFDFQSSVADGGEEITIKFEKCAVKGVLERGGLSAGGDAPLCTIFHEHLAGLLGTFANKRYLTEVISAGSACELKYATRK